MVGCKEKYSSGHMLGESCSSLGADGLISHGGAWIWKEGLGFGLKKEEFFILSTLSCMTSRPMAPRQWGMPDREFSWREDMFSFWNRPVFEVTPKYSNKAMILFDPYRGPSVCWVLFEVLYFSWMSPSLVLAACHWVGGYSSVLLLQMKRLFSRGSSLRLFINGGVGILT